MSKAFNERQIIVVSGLPRSGTSLMMQMLQAGGIPLYADHKRNADIHNPKGYFESDKVKKLLHDSSRLNQAKGKAVKIVSPLLFQLSSNLSYKIIFMQRDLDEVILSQNKMLGHSTLDKTRDSVLKKYYLKHLSATELWMKKSDNVEYTVISFKTLFLEAARVAEKISRFLHTPLPVEKMAAAVKPSLYRTKKKD